MSKNPMWYVTVAVVALAAVAVGKMIPVVKDYL